MWYNIFAWYCIRFYTCIVFNLGAPVRQHWGFYYFTN
nr:MAG TPA: hypothetical protein [Caudoviricetes sp.]